MITITCIRDKNCWGDKLPANWSMGFEESEMSIDEAAAEMRNILYHMGFHPANIAEVFDPELLKSWGMGRKDD